jgi:hypothetical protein
MPYVVMPVVLKQETRELRGPVVKVLSVEDIGQIPIGFA